MPKELPEMDTGKEVHVVQHGEEHVASNSMAASKVKGDLGNEKQGEESEEGTHPSNVGAAAAGASYLHPLLLEESESDSEDQTWINHPSSSPEGSLLHAVYFQLLGAGFDGMTVRELFRSRVLHTWRKAFSEKPVAAALAEPEMEFDQEMQQSMGDMPLPSRVGNQREDDSSGEQLQQQQMMPESVPRRQHYVAAKKTAANVDPSQFQGLIRTRTTRPLPPHIASRRKAPVKNKGYLKNRLQ